MRCWGLFTFAKKAPAMIDLMTRIRQLQRPALLARAARFGADDYRRAVHLPRILKTHLLPRPAAAIMQLLDLEQVINDRRIAKTGDYSPARHVDILIAISAEARLLAATTPRAVEA
jgi:hypothetical protein